MKKGNGGPVFLVVLIISVALIVGLAVFSARKDVEEVQKIQETEVIQQQNAQELGEAMQGIRNDVEQGYEDLEQQIGN